MKNFIIKNIGIFICFSFLLLLLIVFIKTNLLYEYLDNPNPNISLDTISDTISDTKPNISEDTTSKKLCEEGCSIAPVTIQILNINKRLDDIEKINVKQDMDIHNNTVLIGDLAKKIKETEDGIDQASKINN
jgi:hypothetical protein